NNIVSAYLLLYCLWAKGIELKCCIKPGKILIHSLKSLSGGKANARLLISPQLSFFPRTPSDTLTNGRDKVFISIFVQKIIAVLIPGITCPLGLKMLDLLAQ
ncbi:MAG: hypothetical protein AAFU64_04355, partial [Bacteroidota bacterium]